MSIPLKHSSVVISTRLWESGSEAVGDAGLAKDLGECGLF